MYFLRVQVFSVPDSTYPLRPRAVQSPDLILGNRPVLEPDQVTLVRSIQAMGSQMPIELMSGAVLSPVDLVGVSVEHKTAEMDRHLTVV